MTIKEKMDLTLMLSKIQLRLKPRKMAKKAREAISRACSALSVVERQRRRPKISLQDKRVVRTLDNQKWL